MKTTWAVMAVLGVTLMASAWVTPALALQAGGVAVTPRSLGMGNTGIGIADDAAAWYQNPAGLGALNWEPRPGHHWTHQGLGMWNRSDNDENAFAGTWSAYLPGMQLGKGAGWGWLGGAGRGGGFGLGKGLGDSGFSIGANAMYCDPYHEDAESDWTVNAGLMFHADPMGRPLRIGMLFSDLNNQTDNGPYWNLGASYRLNERWLLATDVLDVTDRTEEGPYLNFGAEYNLGGLRDWKLRGGLTDTWDGHKVSLGAGVKLGENRLDLGWQDAPGGSLWGFSVGRGW